ncbi:hypothetical protein, partial [Streptomyces mirabilis]|uniref:hypothetical protein n=1 Tax=Streptomyces mirabilis TaxID=68239 RepID=UPI00225AD0CE
MDIRDLDEHIERHLPLLELDLLADISNRLAVLCHGVLRQYVNGLPKECERVIHMRDCRLVPGALSQVTVQNAAVRDTPGHSRAPRLQTITFSDSTRADPCRAVGWASSDK